MINTKRHFALGAQPLDSGIAPSRPIVTRATSFAFVWLVSFLTLHAQSATGMIEGRVLNQASGLSLERARITIVGTTLETYTDADGYYRISDVASGTLQVKAFFTGLAPDTGTVVVAAGGSVRHDIELSTIAPGGTNRAGTVVEMNAFTVSTSRELDAAALAINEQRFAPNMKSVVSADEYGAIADGNVAEFMKFLPGVAISLVGGDAREVSIGGVPSANVPVTVGGFDFGSAAPNQLTTRAAQVGFLSINNLSRVEVDYSPTPESQGMALAGSVNMVPRSAFERLRPSFNLSFFVMMRDNYRDFQKTPGPTSQPERKVHPGFEFSGIVPVNKRFGFTVSANKSKQYSNEVFASAVWRGVGTATNGAAFPHTTPDKPYLSAYTVGDHAKDIQRSSFGATVDYKLTPSDRLALSFQYSTFGIVFFNRNLAFNLNQVGSDFTTTSAHGIKGVGSVVNSNGGFYRDNRTYLHTLTWRHDGRVWRAAAGAGYAPATYSFRVADKSYFSNTSAQRTGLTVAFDGISYLRPGTIAVTDGGTGAPVDPYQLGNFALVTANIAPQTAYDIRRTAYANLRRDFSGPVPVTLKAGIEFRGAVRDIRSYNELYTYVGRDGRASTTPVGTDDSATPFVDATFSQRVGPWGFPQIQWVSNSQTFDYYRANPATFTTVANTNYRNAVTGSQRAGEDVSAAYIRGDTAFMEGRLKFVGGVRLEQTNVTGEGSLSDPTRNFQRNSQGQVLVAANGVPLPITTDALAASRLTFIDRGAQRKKEYLRPFPSLNASFNLRENLVFRSAYFYSIGRPDYSQYSGGLTLPNLENPPGPNNVITVNNVGIKPWSAKSATVRLEYYFAGVGQISVGAFRRDFRDFFGGTTFPANPGFLSLYGLDSSLYGPFDVQTQMNIPGLVRIEGTTYNYKQALTFLPAWARGVQVFANASAMHAAGNTLNSFTGAFVVPRSGSWGVSLTRERFDLRASWNYKSRWRGNRIAEATGIAPGTYVWTPKRLQADVIGEYRLTKHISVYANLRNVGDVPDDVQQAGPSTPAMARLNQRQQYGSLWTFGVRGTF
ncbi:MAG: TonB-dependent receptor [Opitutus sp.]|nr:TonB-dependent receptor [Opitutus sp.]